MIKQLIPTIRIGRVEVMSVNDTEHTLSALYHVRAGEPIGPEPQTQTKMRSSVKSAIQYMETEGFLPPKQNWTIQTSIVVYPPSTNK